MREFQEKHIFRRRLYSKTMLIVLLVLIILIGRGVINVYAKEKASRNELERIRKEQVVIQDRHNSLLQNSDRLKTEDGVEAEIRGKFDVAKTGEGVIVIVDKKPPEVEEDNRGVIQKLWDSIIGVFKKEPESKP